MDSFKPPLGPKNRPKSMIYLQRKTIQRLGVDKNIQEMRIYKAGLKCLRPLESFSMQSCNYSVKKQQPSVNQLVMNPPSGPPPYSDRQRGPYDDGPRAPYQDSYAQDSQAPT